jgi:hypothetical protein
MLLVPFSVPPYFFVFVKWKEVVGSFASFPSFEWAE